VSVDIIIPWQDGCVYREMNLEWTLNQWNDRGYNPIVGYQPAGEPFTKAIAVANGLAKSDADVIVMTDGDLWVDTIFDSIADVEGGLPWSMPHHVINRMNPQATSRVLSGGHLGGPWAQRPYRAVLGGGILAIRRDVYDDCPLDPRFAGWGQEDESWGIALRTLHPGGREARGDLWHLWHPPADRKNRRTGTNEGMQLRNRYALAKKQGPEVMRALMAEV
jgi:hypothetical protein